MQAESDSELYLMAAAGHRGAVEALVLRYHQTLVRYARTKGVDDAAADDAVSEAWMQLFRHLDRVADDRSAVLDKPESIYFWLLKATVNGLRKGYRSASGQQARTDRLAADPAVGVDAGAGSAESAESSVVAWLDADERRTRFRVAFDALSDRCRELLALLMVDPPLSYAEIADELDRPIGSIGPTRQRCLDSLRANLRAAA